MTHRHFSLQHLFIFDTTFTVCWSKSKSLLLMCVFAHLHSFPPFSREKATFFFAAAFLQLHVVKFCSFSSWNKKKNKKTHKLRLRIYFVLFWRVNFPKEDRKKIKVVKDSVCILPFPHLPLASSLVNFVRRTCKDKEEKCDDMKGERCCVKKRAIMP